MTDAVTRTPQTPPREEAVLSRHPGLDVRRALRAGTEELQNRRYDPWEKVRRRDPPEGLTREGWWWGIKQARAAGRRGIGLEDPGGRPFTFTPTDAMAEAQHRVDLSMGGRVPLPDAITSPETRGRYLVSSLVEEAFRSSQIEGAAVTRDRAREMIRTDRKARDRDERMILNNYLTMEWLKQKKDEPVTPETLLEIQCRMTEGTLKDPGDAGRFRGADREIDISDAYGHVSHVPPPAGELPGRVAALCAFANAGSTPPDASGASEDTGRAEPFLHPLIRSVLLHFWPAYDHPFVDGNGRTARALFYWSMLRHGYWLFEFVSISSVIRQTGKRYDRAYLHTETDGNDLNFFIHYHLEVVERAVQELHRFIERKSQSTRDIERRLRDDSTLNHRQLGLLSHALRHPGHGYLIRSHQSSHGVSYQTARTDLLDLHARGLLGKRKRGNADRFVPVPDLEARLADAR